MLRCRLHLLSCALTSSRAYAPQATPESFRKSGAPKSVIDIIEKLVAVDPSKRPSADDLLGSSLLPPRAEIEQAYLEDAVRVRVNLLPIPHIECFTRRSFVHGGYQVRVVLSAAHVAYTICC